MSQAEDTQLSEYAAAQECYLHYDSFRWQAGSILIAGVFVFWGLLLGGSQAVAARNIGVMGGLVSILMTIWVLFAHHYRQIYLYKLHRIQELEAALGMQQHTRFLKAGRSPLPYQVFGPKGHDLDLAMYAATSLGGSLVGSLQGVCDIWLLLPVPIVLMTIAIVLNNERRVQKALIALRTVASTLSAPSLT